MTSRIRLRPWQRAAYDLFRRSDGTDFLAVATPGAGKTMFALTCARAWLAESPRHLPPDSTPHPRPLVVVAPTSHLKVQWSLAAHQVGLELDPAWTPATGLARDVHGLVTTYQQVATGDTARVLHTIGADGFVILDEIHHAGHERAWGDGIRAAFAGAGKRLSLSGTPFRSDTAAIPFVRYDTTAEGEAAQSDYTYGYADALRDGGVARPVYFPRVDGQMEWSAPDGSVLSATFHDALSGEHASWRLRTALSLDGEWLPAVLAQANEQLRAIRSEHPDAGGLVIAADREHAHGIARLLRDRLRTPAEVVVSDDPTASRRIAAFADSDKPWLVAVRMVSEGVDIPRLRVGVYATTTTTELFFRQAVGRFVRWQSGRKRQKAYLFLPDDVRLRTHAFQIAEARRHVLRPPDPQDDEPAIVDAEDAAPFDDPDDGESEQLSLFSALSAVVTSVEVHGVVPDGADEIGHYDDEPDIPEPDFDALDDALAVELPSIPTASGATPMSGGLSVAERKNDLRTRNAELARRLVDLTGWSHSRVNAEMNRLAGVTKVATATSDQLERRIRYAESWLRRLKRG